MQESLVAIELAYVEGRAVVRLAHIRSVRSQIDGHGSRARGQLAPAGSADRRAHPFRVRIHEQIGSGELLVQVAVDLGSDRAGRGGAPLVQVLDRVELEAGITPAHDAHARALDDVEDDELHRVLGSAARFGPHLHVEKTALRIERANLVGEVRGRVVRLGIKGEDTRQHGCVEMLVPLEAGDEERPRVDPHAQFGRRRPGPGGTHLHEIVRNDRAVPALGAEPLL